MLNATSAAIPEAAPLLLELLSGTRAPAAVAASALDDQSWEAVAALARRLHVGPLLWSRLRAADLDRQAPDGIGRRLKEEYRRNALRNLGLIAQVTHLDAALRAHGVPVLLLKGLHVAQEVYENLSDRVVGDIDLLVPADRAPDAVAALSGIGYAPSSWPALNEAAILAVNKHLPAMLKADAAPVEIHGSLVDRGRTPAEALEGFWQRARPVPLGPAAPAGLSREDLLLYLCAHASYQHLFATGLRPYCDIATAIQRWGVSIEWAVVCERARRWGWHRGVSLTIDVTRALFGVTPPADAAAELSCPGDDPGRLAAALAQVFAHGSEATGVQLNLAKMWHEPTIAGKVRQTAGRIFLPAGELAGRYPVSPRSPARFWYYGVRLIDLLKHHAGAAWRLHRRDPELRSIAARTQQLAAWLADG